MHTTAAICYGPDSNFKIEPVELATPRATEVLVRLRATGLCHTDLSVREGLIPFPTPCVLGHEGAGVVEQIGPDVTVVAPGDHVVLTSPSCGQCPQCYGGHPALCNQGPQLRWSGVRADGSHVVTQNGTGIAARFLGQSTFAGHTLVEERTVVKIDDDVPPSTLAPFGCGVITGAGAILRVLRPEPGSTVVVLGGGAVGLSAVMAAALLPVSRIIVADLVPSRLALARDLGAGETIHSTDTAELSSIIRDLTGGHGADTIVDTTGNTKVLEQAFGALAQRGTLGLIGAGRADSVVGLPLMPFLSAAQSVRAILMGDGTPPFLRTLVDHHRHGRFPVDKLVRTYPFLDIEEAAADAHSGATVKPVLTFE